MATAPVAGAVEGLSLVGAQEDSLQLAVPASGLVPLVFHRTPAEGAAVFDVDLGAFLSEDDQSASVAIRPLQDDLDGQDGRAGPARVAQLRFAAGEHRAVLELQAEGLVPGVEYSGTLTASAPDGLATWGLSLRRPAPAAELVTDLDAMALDVVLGAGARDAEASRTVVVREKTGDVGVEGLRVRRAEGTEPKGAIDLRRNLRFEIDGEPIPRLTSWPDESHETLRNIPAGEQRSLLVAVADLPRGEHQLSLQLDAVNAAPDAAPTLDLTVRVRHSIGWAFLVLLVAISISFLLTTGIVNWRRRLRLQARTRALRREWLRELPALAPVIWLQATRRQAEIVLDRFPLLPAPEQLTERLDRAARLLALLRRVRDLHRRLEKSPFPYMLRYRMDRELDGIVRPIEPEILDEAAAAAFTAALDALEKDLGEPAARYRRLVTVARKKAQAVVRLDDLRTRGKQRERLRKLMRGYVDADPPEGATERELVLIDRVCSSLRVLWRHRDDEDLQTELLGLVARENADDIPIERVFELSNEEVAKRIAREVEAGRTYLSPTGRRARASEVEALQPTRFEVGVEDGRLDDGFMLKSRILAAWHFELTPRPRRGGWWRRWRAGGSPPQRKPIPWHQTCPGKTLFQFAPEPGLLNVSVELRHGRLKTRPVEGELPVVPSFGGIRSRLPTLEEWVLVSVSAVIALASGLVLYYLPNPTFGSLQDYLALFTWGVGVDQGKNLVQTFQSLRSQAKADEAGGSP
jgi:hypothetical protein